MHTMGAKCVMETIVANERHSELFPKIALAALLIPVFIARKLKYSKSNKQISSICTITACGSSCDHKRFIYHESFICVMIVNRYYSYC